MVGKDGDHLTTLTLTAPDAVIFQRMKTRNTQSESTENCIGFVLNTPIDVLQQFQPAQAFNTDVPDVPNQAELWVRAKLDQEQLEWEFDMAHEIDPPAAALVAAVAAAAAIPAEPPATPLSTHLYRIAVGGLGGIAATCVKYLSQHHEKVSSLIENDQAAKAYAILYGLLIIAAVLFFLGGLIGWASQEINSLKLLALGISAPALVTTWSAKQEEMMSGQVDKVAIESHLGLIQPALAEDSSTPRILFSIASDTHGYTLLDGLKEVLGWNVIEQNYWVVVGSYLDKGAAEQHVKNINREDPTMKAFVGKQRPGNDYYPVIVGNFTSREDAEKLMVKALKLETVGKAYLSDYADRKP